MVPQRLIPMLGVLGFARRRVILAIVGIFVILISSCVLYNGWNANQFPYSGDGMLTDSGFWSYPRYRIDYQPCQVGQGSCVYHFKGVPSGAMTFGLRLDSGTSGSESANALDALIAQNAELVVEIKEADKVLWRVKDNLKSWELRRSATKKVFWHPKLRDLHFSADKTYSLIVELCNADAKNKNVFMYPLLEGGGNELP